MSVAKLSHWPPQRLNPASHVYVHPLLTHAGWALATLVVQARPQLPQLPAIAARVDAAPTAVRRRRGRASRDARVRAARGRTGAGLAARRSSRSWRRRVLDACPAGAVRGVAGERAGPTGARRLGVRDGGLANVPQTRSLRCSWDRTHPPSQLVSPASHPPSAAIDESSPASGVPASTPASTANRRPPPRSRRPPSRRRGRVAWGRDAAIGRDDRGRGLRAQPGQLPAPRRNETSKATSAQAGSLVARSIESRTPGASMSSTPRAHGSSFSGSASDVTPCPANRSARTATASRDAPTATASRATSYCLLRSARDNGRTIYRPRVPAGALSSLAKPFARDGTPDRLRQRGRAGSGSSRGARSSSSSSCGWGELELTTESRLSTSRSTCQCRRSRWVRGRGCRPRDSWRWDRPRACGDPPSFPARMPRRRSRCP